MNDKIQETLNNLRYAKEMLGENNRSHFDELRNVTKDTYNTNLGKTNLNYANAIEDLEKQRINSERSFNSGINDVVDTTFSNNYNAINDLNKRGLNTSGVANKLFNTDTINRGSAIEKLLKATGSELVGVGNSYSKLNTNVAGEKEKLMNNLANALGGIGGKDLANQMRYNQALSTIANTKAQRDMQNALARARSGGSREPSKQDKEINEFYRKRAMLNIVRNTDAEGNSLNLTPWQRQVALSVLYNVKDPVAVMERYRLNTSDDMNDINRDNILKSKLDSRLREEFKRFNQQNLGNLFTNNKTVFDGRQVSRNNENELMNIGNNISDLENILGKVTPVKDKYNSLVNTQDKDFKRYLELRNILETTNKDDLNKMVQNRYGDGLKVRDWLFNQLYDDISKNNDYIDRETGYVNKMKDENYRNLINLFD